MNPVQQLAELKQRHDQILTELCLHIESLPDNPRIKRLSSNAFTISSKNLGDNWSAEHHDFKRCYQLIVQYLRKQSPAMFLARFKGIITAGRLIVNPAWQIKLHPDVVAHLDRVYRGEPCQLRLTTCPVAASAGPSSSSTRA